MSIEIPPDVAARLAREQIIWLTTTRTDGTPLPNPVWFLWSSGQFLIFTEPGSVKMRNMTRNPRVALNLNADFDGGDVAIFQAMAERNGPQVSEAEQRAYLAKYETGIQSIGLTPEKLLDLYRPVKIKPIKFRTVPEIG